MLMKNFTLSKHHNKAHECGLNSSFPIMSLKCHKLIKWPILSVTSSFQSLSNKNVEIIKELLKELLRDLSLSIP